MIFVCGGFDRLKTDEKAGRGAVVDEEEQHGKIKETVDCPQLARVWSPLSTGREKSSRF